MGESDRSWSQEEREILAALHDVPLRSADCPDADPGINEAHAELAAALLRVVNTGISEAVLTWPGSPDGLVAVHALATLGVSARSGTHAPSPVRVAYFPWTTRAGDSAKRALADREWVVRAHRHGLTRALRPNPNVTANPMLKLHEAMVRLQDLDGEVQYRGKWQTLRQYRHPALAELVASGPDTQAQKPLLFRTRRFTRIATSNPVEGIDGLKNCPFALVGIPDDNSYTIPVELTGDVDGILVNGLLRRWEAFGDGWVHHVVHALAIARAAWQRPLPVLAVTDDPWMQWVFRRDILPKHLGDDSGKLRATTVLLEPSRIFEKRPPFEAQGAEDLVFFAPSGAPAAIEKLYRSLMRDAGSLEEQKVLGLLQDSRRAFRNLASLPTSLGRWKKYLLVEAEMSPEDVADALRRLDPTGPLNRIDSEFPEALSVQANLEMIAELRSTLREFVERHMTTETSVAAVFRQLLEERAKNGEPLAVIIADERVREFIDQGLCARAEDGESARVLVYSLPQFRPVVEGRSVPGTPPTSAIILGVSRRALMQLLSGRWLPRQVAVIADVTTIGHIAANSERLEKRPELSRLAERLGRVYVAADACLKACVPELPGVEFDRPAPPEFDGQQLGGIVDLTGMGPQDGGPQLKLRTDSGAVLICRPKSTIVVFDPDAPVDPFRAEQADAIHPGERICVLTRGFFEAVREQLGSSAAVAADVRAYHHFVADTISRFPGATYADKTHRIVRAMSAKECRVSEGQVGDWIRADRWLREGDTTVRPHAPLHYRDFHAFMEVLGAPQPLISRFWQFGVLATRSMRLSAAQQFYELCIAILTKYQDMVAQHPNRVTDFSDIRARAEGTVAAVTAVVGAAAVAVETEPLAQQPPQQQLKFDAV